MTTTWESIASTTDEGEKKRLGQQSSHRGDMSTTQRPLVYGHIIAPKQMTSRQGIRTLRVRLHLEGRDSKITRGVEDNWYGLAYPVDFIAHAFGNDLVGRRCSLEYKTIDPNSGIVYITYDDNFESDLEMAEALPPIPTILGTPGSGL